MNNKLTLGFLSLIFIFSSCTEKNNHVKNVEQKTKPVLRNYEKVEWEKYETIKQFYPSLIQGRKVADDWFLIEIPMDNNDSSKNRIFYDKYGNLFLKYKRKNYVFRVKDEFHFPITNVEYYFKKGNKLIKLGKQDLNGVYDKNNKLLASVPSKEKFLEGYDSFYLFQSPFDNYMCRLKPDNSIQLLDQHVYLNIDYGNNSIKAFPSDLIEDGRKIPLNEYKLITDFFPSANEWEKGTKISSGEYELTFSFENSDYKDYKNFYEKFGNLYIRYKREDYVFFHYKKIHFPINSVEYFYKKGNDLISLGKIDIDGVYDSKNDLILKTPETRYTIEGYDSLSIFEKPLSLVLCLQKDDGFCVLADEYGVMTIDCENASLIARSINDFE